MALFREQTSFATEMRKKAFESVVGLSGAHERGNRKGDTDMAMSRNITAGQFILGLTFAVCALSLVDTRFRKACFGLLCRLQ